jgi:tRNA threonylcarbamoyladenosine modification (KEOPS) complex Cgi121 subunit/molybdopterin converting factor small subunit
MITIRLLGGVKKALGGKASVQLEKPSATVLEILDFLKSLSSEPQLLNPGNLIVAINGVDSAALAGSETLAKSGDTVTVVTVVHGGKSPLGTIYAGIVGARNIGTSDISELLESLRKVNQNASVQAVRADMVFGIEHVSRVLMIVLKARERQVMMANKVEAELLLRLACTDQISEAIARIGLRPGMPGCFVGFSEDAEAVSRFKESIHKKFEMDDSVLMPTTKKKRVLAKLLSIDAETPGSEFLNHLVERAAILTK